MERRRPRQPDQSRAFPPLTSNTLVKCLKEHLAAKQDGATSSALRLVDRGTIAQLVAGIVVHRDRLVVRFKPDHTDETSERLDDQCS
jgi:hypothetical protein